MSARTAAEKQGRGLSCERGAGFGGRQRAFQARKTNNPKHGLFVFETQGVSEAVFVLGAPLWLLAYAAARGDSIFIPTLK